MPSHADRLANHLAITTQEIAHDIANESATSTELIEALEQVWLKERADHDGDDQLWLRVVVALPIDTLNAHYDAAYQTGRYAAARCLAWHRARRS